MIAPLTVDPPPLPDDAPAEDVRAMCQKAGRFTQAFFPSLWVEIEAPTAPRPLFKPGKDDDRIRDVVRQSMFPLQAYFSCRSFDSDSASTLPRFGTICMWSLSAIAQSVRFVPGRPARYSQDAVDGVRLRTRARNDRCASPILRGAPATCRGSVDGRESGPEARDRAGGHGARTLTFPLAHQRLLSRFA